MIILAFDPGTNSTGWAVVDVRGGRSLSLPITTTFFDAGNIPSEPDAIEAVIGTTSGAIIAIEKLEGGAFVNPSRGAQALVSNLLASSNVAGMIRGLAYAHRRTIVEMSAKAWRKLVCGNGSATDPMIKSAVMRLVHGLPTRTNVHIRDAVGLGLGAGWHLGGER